GYPPTPDRCPLLFVSLPFLLPPPAATRIYTLSLHDALPISQARPRAAGAVHHLRADGPARVDVDQPDRADHRHRGHAQVPLLGRDRKSTRLNSSHVSISYAVFCLKKKKRAYWFIALLLVCMI